MERQETKRNKSSTKENDISLKVFCLAPTVNVSENRDTSVYEIDIQSDFEFHTGQVKERGIPVGVSVSKVSNRDIALENSKREAKHREHKNPFFQAYYPNLLQTHIEENETQSEADPENESRSEKVREIETQSEGFQEKETQSETLEEKETQSETPPNTAEMCEKPQMTMAEGKKESAVQKVDKENQSPSLHEERKLQKHMKSFIIENFFSKNKNDLKAMFKNYDKKLDTNELHLHHHEHHHHYYFDGSFLPERSSTSTKREQAKSKQSRESKFHDKKMFENISKANNYANQCSSNLTFTQVKTPASDVYKTDPEEPDDSLEHIPSCPTKSSVSLESVVLKKSDFIKSHVYSDTDLAKCDSPDVETSTRESRKSSRSNFGVLVNSLKSLNQLRSPLIITDQQTVPKFSYITCECTSVDTLGNLSNVSLFSSDHLDDAEEAGRTSCESSESVKSTVAVTQHWKEVDGWKLNHLKEHIKQYKHKDARRVEVNKSERKLYFELWKAQLKTELRQIKKDISRFEEVHFKGKDSFSTQPRFGTEAPESKVDHKIAVYSRKTYIMGPQNLCFRKACHNCRGLLVAKNRKAYEESAWKKAPLRPAEGKANFKKKRGCRSFRLGVLQRI